jgi:hypothetical protein
MLEAGEKITSAVSHRDFILLFGDCGTILRMEYDFDSDQFQIRTEGRVPTK